MTDLRASFEIRTGMYTTAGRFQMLHPKSLAGYWVPDRLRPMLAERANAPVNEISVDESLLCLNGRWVLPDLDLINTPGVGEAVLEAGSGDVVAARLRRADAEYFLKSGQFHERVRVRQVEERILCRFPWDIIALMKETIPVDIEVTRILEERLAPPNCHMVGEGAVKIHASATIFPGVVFDTTQGDLILHERSIIRPGAILCGPCSIGRGATVLDHSILKPFTVIGPVCKVAGEVGGTIFQGYSNKAHDGHLGDSWVGKWVNFGAGTTNSNLLNTYGEVSMRIEPEGPRRRTGLHYLGAIIGDHTKFAINTRLMTGTVVGTGSMIAMSTPPPTTIPRFSWLTDHGARRYQIDKFLKVMESMMARRGMSSKEAYFEQIRGLHHHSSLPEMED